VSKGETHLILGNVGRRVTEVRHPSHDRKDKCVIDLVLAAPVEKDVEVGGDKKSQPVFRVEGSHDLAEAIMKYSDESKGDDVLVIMPGKMASEKVSYAILPRQGFHEAIKEDLRSQAPKYIG
jgi:hypothetical protein